ncbi:hypothetical protein E143388_07048 [Rhodococcus opacus]|nr:hypothetical protein E143388_07048 [Rhodococcus opacus]
MLGGRQRHELGLVPRSGHRQRGIVRVVVEVGGQDPWCPVLEHGPDVDVGVQHRIDPRHHPCRRQRVSARLEEVVVDTDVLEPQNGRERVRDGLLDGRRRSVRGIGRGVEPGSGQRGAIEFADGGQRDPVDRHDRTGHHVRRKSFGEIGRESCRGELRGTDDIGDEDRVPGGPGAGECRGVLHVRVVAEDGVDLAGFDAEPAHLHLEVGAAEVLDHPTAGRVGDPADDVAGPVHPLARRPVWSGDEASCGQARPPVVSAGQT